MDKPDILARVTLIPTTQGGKTRPCYSGYRPCHLIKKDYLTSGKHEYIDVNFLAPGETAMAFIKFISPTYYPKILSVGQVINIQEGNKVVGYATVIEIHNNLLRKD